MPFAGEAWALLIYGISEYSAMNGALAVLALGFSLANLNLLPESLRNQINQNPISTTELSLLGAVTFILLPLFGIVDSIHQCLCRAHRLTSSFAYLCDALLFGTLDFSSHLNITARCHGRSCDGPKRFGLCGSCFNPAPTRP